MTKKLYFYYSAMNAGKSTTLLQSSYNYIERGMQTILFAPKIDNRFGGPTIYSRIGLKQSAIGYDEEFNLYGYVKEKKKELKELTCILVDEAHFLKKNQVAQLVKIASDLDIAVLCYGLRSDFLGEPFEGSNYLLAWAQELMEIKTICHCGSKATMNIRVDNEGNPITKGNQVAVLGNAKYVSSCMKHFREAVPEMDRYATNTYQPS
ncbi:thymidine kinase [Candidatus Aerophobetes bacterium]|uniref:Thymidine kinase n=1 Tax=Aerophobetes bacterium TaxID=2030807 RepID=A0A2A4YIU5_UNCAE|nr:MAG: thymidine kinase [Candidatus Aerophobetes bacterium]